MILLAIDIKKINGIIQKNAMFKKNTKTKSIKNSTFNQEILEILFIKIKNKRGNKYFAVSRGEILFNLKLIKLSKIYIISLNFMLYPLLQGNLSFIFIHQIIPHLDQL